MTPSLWRDTLPADLAQPLGPPLTDDAQADVAIVGAGFTGLWTAYWLTVAEPGLRVIIVEAQESGFGASGRNGGWASALFPVGMPTLVKASGQEAAVRMMRTMQASVDDLGAVARRESWGIEWSKGGTLDVARTPLQLARLRDTVDAWRTWGFGSDDVALLGAGEALERFRATDALGALYTPHCAAIHPLRLVRELARTVRDRGVRVFEHSPVHSIEPGIIRTPSGSVRAPIVIRATEAYSAGFSGQRRAIAPIYSLMIATEPLTQSAWDAIGLRARETFTDGRNLLVYGQRTADDRIAFGGRGAPYHFASRISPAHDRHPRVHESLRRALCDLIPQASAARVTHEWGGPLGMARDRWPSCGLDRRTGIGWAGGYVGDGVVTSFLAGQTLADLILEHPSERVSLPWVAHQSPRWEPEPLRWIGINAVRSIVARGDAVEGRTGRASVLTSRFLAH